MSENIRQERKTQVLNNPYEVYGQLPWMVNYIWGKKNVWLGCLSEEKHLLVLPKIGSIPKLLVNKTAQAA